MMKRVFIWSAIAALCLSGCTTMRTVDHQGFPLTDLVAVGNTYTFTKTSGSRIVMEVTEVTNSYVVGTRANGLGTTIEVNDLREIEVEKVEGGKTTLAVLGGIVIVPIAIVGVIVLGLAALGVPL